MPRFVLSIVSGKSVQQSHNCCEGKLRLYDTPASLPSIAVIGAIVFRSGFAYLLSSDIRK